MLASNAVARMLPVDRLRCWLVMPGGGGGRNGLDARDNHATATPEHRYVPVVLSQVAEYAREYFPEIVAPLKLP